MDPGLIQGEDGVTRCWWCGNDPLYVAYHDEEWGRPVTDDRRLFEKLCLEGFQSGLSWLTILRKRERFRAVFNDFDPEAVARFTKRDVARLLGDSGIVRHRGKIESAINNAKRTLEIVETHGSLTAFVWRFEPEASAAIDHATLLARSRTEESASLSKALRQRGFTFIGPVTAYAFMQAVGMVNDHLPACASWKVVEDQQKRFSRHR